MKVISRIDETSPASKWPLLVAHFPLRPWAGGQPWNGSANDRRTKAKCLTARPGRSWPDLAQCVSLLSSVGGMDPGSWALVADTSSAWAGSVYLLFFLLLPLSLLHVDSLAQISVGAINVTHPYHHNDFAGLLVLLRATAPCNSLLKCPLIVLHSVKHRRIGQGSLTVLLRWV